MRILHVITRLVAGGAQRNTLLCAADQARRGHQVTLVSGTETGPEGSLWPEARRLPLRLLELPSLVRDPRPLADALALGRLWWLMTRDRYDVVHTHTSKAGALGRLAARAAGTRSVVHTPHGHVFQGYFSPARTRLFLLVERLLAPLADRLVMLTEGCREEHLRAGVGTPEQLVVIPSGVDVSRYQAAGPRWEGVPQDRLVVGSVARLVEVKGHLPLLEAFAQVAREVPEAHLVIAGQGPLRASLEQRIRELGLEGRVTLPGHLERVEELLRRLDLFVLASENEGMGRAVVEAMAAGVPVVATRVGGMKDLVEPGYTGLLVNFSRQPQELAEAILHLLKNPALRQAMGERARAASWQWSEQVMFERLEALYGELWARR